MNFLFHLVDDTFRACLICKDFCFHFIFLHSITKCDLVFILFCFQINVVVKVKMSLLFTLFPVQIFKRSKWNQNNVAFFVINSES